MPYSDDEEHSPSEFYYPDEISDETNYPNGRLEGENAEQNSNKNSQEKMEEFINNQKAKTTITKTKSDMKVFQRYLETVNKGEKQIEYLPKAELDHLCTSQIQPRSGPPPGQPPGNLTFEKIIGQMPAQTGRNHSQIPCYRGSPGSGILAKIN